MIEQGRPELEFQPLSKDEDGVTYGRLSTLSGRDIMAVCTLDEAASEFPGVVITCRPMLRVVEFTPSAPARCGHGRFCDC